MTNQQSSHARFHHFAASGIDVKSLNPPKYPAMSVCMCVCIPKFWCSNLLFCCDDGVGMMMAEKPESHGILNIRR